MVAEDIIIAPVVTEKSSDGIAEGKYTFKVNKKATKICFFHFDDLSLVVASACTANSVWHH